MVRPRWYPPTVPFTRAMSGVSNNALYSSIKRGETLTIRPGVYLSASAWPTDEMLQHQIKALADQMARPYLVASHQTAALSHGLPLLDTSGAASSPPRFTRAPGVGVRSSRTPHVSVREIPLEQLTEVSDGIAQGLRITCPARTAIDLAAELDLSEALMLTDHVARQALIDMRGTNAGDLSLAIQQATIRSMTGAAGSVAQQHSRIVAVLQHTLAIRESPAESASYGHFVMSHLPLPVCQKSFTLGRDVVRVDFYWEDFQLVGECDGSVKYDRSLGGSGDVLVRQNEREQALRELGVAVVRWAAAEILYRPLVVIDRVTARLLALGWGGASGASPGY
jgi:hypothetical protein